MKHTHNLAKFQQTKHLRELHLNKTKFKNLDICAYVYVKHMKRHNCMELYIKLEVCFNILQNRIFNKILLK